MPQLARLFDSIEESLTEARDYALDAVHPEGGYSPECILVGLSHLRTALLELGELRSQVARLDGNGNPANGADDEPSVGDQREAEASGVHASDDVVAMARSMQQRRHSGGGTS
jgi:hypothetical protein